MENPNSQSAADLAKAAPAEAKPLKLNVKRTAYIGIAFFGILLLWGVYNSYCGNFLTYLFAENIYGLDSEALRLPENASKFIEVQYLVGIIMALDNLAALFLMPIFGNLSDKTHSKIGKRMPYIIVGTIVSAIVLPFIPLFFGEGYLNNNLGLAVPGVIVSMVVVLLFMMMYRSPAVALMPDLTPKPLRSRANGIINIIGYLGGAVAVVFGMVMPFSNFVSPGKPGYKNIWWVEAPFLVASAVMLLSLGILLWKVKEAKIEAEVADEMRQGDKLSETVDEVKDEGPLSKENRKNLALILIAEVLWFMSFNAVETFMSNYTMFYLNSSTGQKGYLDALNGVMGAIGFLFAGSIADRIGRKKTILIGLCVVVAANLLFCFTPSGLAPGESYTFDKNIPWFLYIIFALSGLGASFIHNCSFPMVVDFCNSGKIGRFTSYYYAASMSAQTITPILIGLIFRFTGEWQALPIYSCALMALALVAFSFVKAPMKTKGANKKGLEAIDIG
jgi:MFS family permease